MCHYAVPHAIPEQPTVQHRTFVITILSINIDCHYAEYCRMLCSVSLCCALSNFSTAHSRAWHICKMILSNNIDCRYAECRRMLLCSVSLCCALSYSRTAHSTARTFVITILSINIDCHYAEYRRMSLFSV